MICSILSASLWSGLIAAVGYGLFKALELWAKKDLSKRDAWDENSYS